MDTDGRALQKRVRELPDPARHALIGAAAFGALGGIVGLVLGLRAYPPTAWFAVVEVGMPTALLGAVLGVAIGPVVRVLHRARGS